MQHAVKYPQLENKLDSNIRNYLYSKILLWPSYALVICRRHRTVTCLVYVFFEFRMEIFHFAKSRFFQHFAHKYRHIRRANCSFAGKCWSKHIKLNHCAGGLDETSWTIRTFCQMPEINWAKISCKGTYQKWACHEVTVRKRTQA